VALASTLLVTSAGDGRAGDTALLVHKLPMLMVRVTPTFLLVGVAIGPRRVTGASSRGLCHRNAPHNDRDTHCGHGRIQFGKEACRTRRTSSDEAPQGIHLVWRSFLGRVDYKPDSVHPLACGKVSTVQVLQVGGCN
jgi:hypothetical protein